jgi:hypothetical protein
MFEKMRGSFKNVEDPSRLYEIKMDIKQSRHEMYEKYFSNLAKPIVKFFTDDWFVLKR